MAARSSRPAAALSLLLAINLFNYIDRYVLAAVEPRIQSAFFRADDASANWKMGLLSTAFLFSYLLLAPVFGWLADRWSRWMLIGGSVALWSLASGASGLAATFGALLVTRIFVGVGEAGYGPAAPTIIADLYPVEKRGQMLARFYLAIPVGSALGYVLGGLIDSHWGWQWSFYTVVPPGLLLAACCFLLPDPRKAALPVKIDWTDLFGLFRSTIEKICETILTLYRIRAYLWNTAAMAAMTFAIGGISFWVPKYVSEYRAAEFPNTPNLLGKVTTIFGAITAVAGLVSTLLGGWAGDKLRARFPSAYFLVSGVGMLLAFPATLGMLLIPFPWAWGCLFIAVFFLFFNTGPANTALANVTPPAIRATAFALNIFTIHLLGDAASPPLTGWIAGRWNMNIAFITMSAVMVVASVCWFWGARYLAADTDAVSSAIKAQ